MLVIFTFIWSYNNKLNVHFQICSSLSLTGLCTYLVFCLSQPPSYFSTCSSWSPNQSKRFSKDSESAQSVYIHLFESFSSGKLIGRRMSSIFASSHYVIQARKQPEDWKSNCLSTFMDVGFVFEHQLTIDQSSKNPVYNNPSIQYQPSNNPVTIHESSAHNLPVCSQVGDLATACRHQVIFLILIPIMYF